MSPCAHSPLARSGLTLVEVLIALLLGAIAAAAVLWFNRTQFLTLEDQARQLDIQTTTRSIVDLFAREARRAGMDPLCSKAFDALVNATATEVRFQSDLNSNGVLEPASEDLTYRFMEGVRVERVAGETAEVLLDGVTLAGSRLGYFDGAGGELVPSPALSAAQRTLVRRVRIELSVGGKPANPDRTLPLTARAATDVELRNRFFVSSTACP